MEAAEVNYKLFYYLFECEKQEFVLNVFIYFKPVQNFQNRTDMTWLKSLRDGYFGIYEGHITLSCTELYTISSSIFVITIFQVYYTSRTWISK